MKIVHLAPILFAAGVTVVACGSGTESAGGDADSSASAGPFTVEIRLDRPDDAKYLMETPHWDYCPRSMDWAGDAVPAKRMKVRVIDANDEVLATTFTEPDAVDVDWKKSREIMLKTGCTLEVTLDSVPRDLDFYTVQADINESNFSDGADSAQVTFSRSEMESTDWVASLVVKSNL